MTQELPNVGCAQVEEKKIVEYLLNLAHAAGGAKARFFLTRGFSISAWQGMRESLTAQGRVNRVTKLTRMQRGTRYQMDCHCTTPDGVNPCIRSVWEIGLESLCSRLLTAYPLSN